MRELIVITLVVLSLWVSTVGITHLQRKYEDNYCLTTPLERINRERCGLTKEDK